MYDVDVYEGGQSHGHGQVTYSSTKRPNGELHVYRDTGKCTADCRKTYLFQASD
jgi:hypothetical protein